MMNKKFFLILLILVVLASMVIFSQNVKKLSMFGYKGETNSVKLIVDTEIARLRKAEPYFPIVIYLGHSENMVLKASRGSFTLQNPDGQSVSLPSYEEVLKGYGTNLMSSDLTYLTKMEDYASMNFLSCKMVSKVCFFPSPSSGSILYDNVEMSNRSYFRTILYFPNNSANKDGIYKLIYEDKEKGIKVETPFEIKWMK